MKVQELLLFSAMDVTPQRKIDNFALGLDIGKLHGLPDKLFVEHDIGSQHTPSDVYGDFIARG